MSPHSKVLLENGFQTMGLCCQDGAERRETHSLVKESCTFSVDWGHLEPHGEHSSGNRIAASAEYMESKEGLVRCC